MMPSIDNKEPISGGVIAAPLTPMDDKGDVNFEVMAEHCKLLLSHGCDGLMPLGSTGENHSLSTSEKILVMDSLATSGLDPRLMMMGTSALSLPETCTLIQHAIDLGVSRVCIQVPFYYRPASPQGIFEYYARIINRISDDRLRIIIYDSEHMTGAKFDNNVLLTLIDKFPETIVGIKESNGDDGRVSSICNLRPSFEVYSGVDTTNLSTIRSGGSGVISSLANVFPRLVADSFYYANHRRGELAQNRLSSAVSVLAKYGFFNALKEYLASITGDSSWANLRPPLHTLESTDRGTLCNELLRITS